MFTNLFGTLTSLLPKNFIFGSYVPVLIFGFINATLLYVHDAAFRDWAYVQLQTPFVVTIPVLFLGSVVVAYVLSSINDFLREVLEGRFVPPRLAKRLRFSEWKRLDALSASYARAQDEGRAVNQGRTDWINRLSRAAAEAPNGATGYSRVTDPAARKLADLRRHRDDMRSHDIDEAVTLMERALKTWDVDIDLGLAADRNALLDLMSDAWNITSETELALFTERYATFGMSAPAPTRMGNVAGALQSYASNLYRIELDTFWSRLQGVIQDGDKTNYEALVSAKTQLDFLVACCWLDALTAAFWLPSLAIFGSSAVTFGAIAIAAPLLFVGFYRLAVTNYLAYAELVRAAVDLNRFALLQRLHIALPGSLRDEQRIWWTLRRLSVLAQADAELSFDHEAKK